MKKFMVILIALMLVAVEVVFAVNKAEDTPCFCGQCEAVKEYQALSLTNKQVQFPLHYKYTTGGGRTLPRYIFVLETERGNNEIYVKKYNYDHYEVGKMVPCILVDGEFTVRPVDPGHTDAWIMVQDYLALAIALTGMVAYVIIRCLDDDYI